MLPALITTALPSRSAAVGIVAIVAPVAPNSTKPVIQQKLQY